MADSSESDKPKTPENAIFDPEIEIIPLVKPDLEVIPDPADGNDLEIGSGLSFRFGAQYSDETYEELEVLRQSPYQPTARERLSEWFGPEMTAGVVIGLLVAIFAILMIAGVRDESTGDTQVPETPAVAPPAEPTSGDTPEVEIGDAVVLERE